MITLEVQKQCFVGFKGERFRFFLSDEGYRNAKRSEQEGGGNQDKEPCRRCRREALS